MTYKIIKAIQNEDTITVTTEYIFSDGLIQTIDVPIFQPGSIDDINNGLNNRGISEQSKLDAIKTASQLVEELTK